jgi:hypothetical protein
MPLVVSPSHSPIYPNGIVLGRKDEEDHLFARDSNSNPADFQAPE